MRRVPKLLTRKDGLAYVTWRQNGHKNFEYFGPAGSDRANAGYRDFVKRWLAAQTPPDGPEPGCTVDRLVEVHLRHADGYYRRPDGTQTTEFKEFTRAYTPLVQLCGDLGCNDFRPRHFKGIRETMIEAGLSLGVINQRMGRIRRLFRYGVAEELVSPSVADALAEVKDLAAGRSQAVEYDPVEAVAWEVVKSSLRQIRYPELKAIILFQWWTGCRPGEACRVAWDDLFVEGAIPLGKSVYHLPQGVWAYKVRAKMAHARPLAYQIYMLGPKAQALVAMQLKGNSTYLWPSPHRPGRPWTTSGYAHAVQKAAALAGVPHWWPHQLRHAAQQRAEKLYGLEGGRKLLGHTSIQTTLGYSQRDLDGAAEIAARLG